MKPIIILPEGDMSAEDVKVLRDNDLCVVMAKNPSAVKFVDPVPSMVQRGKIDDAAIRLSRILLNRTWGKYTQNGALDQKDFTRIYVDLLISGTSLDERGTIGEQEQALFTQAKLDEISRIAREEARGEALARKQAKQAAAKTTK